jgi:homoserine kinase type II
MHTLLANHPQQLEVVSPVVSNYGTPKMLLQWIQQSKQVILASNVGENRNRQIALTRCDESLALLSIMQEQWNTMGERLPQQLVHGDYGGGNILYQQERVVGILDFDFMAVRERIFDIAYSLYWMFWRLETGKPASELSWSWVRAMLQSYTEAAHQPLLQQELQMLPLEIARIPLYWIAEAHLLHNTTQIIAALGDSVTFSLWVVAHSKELFRPFTGG